MSKNIYFQPLLLFYHVSFYTNAFKAVFYQLVNLLSENGEPDEPDVGCLAADDRVTALFDDLHSLRPVD